MKAPEKLYLSKNIYSTFLYQLPDPDDETQVEYSNTDVFIEKAVNYLNSKLCDWVRIEHPNPSVSPNVIIKQDFIDDFKKYMKE